MKKRIEWDFLKTIAVIVVIGLFALAGFMGYLIVTIKSDGAQCSINPYTYGAKLAEETTGSALMCRCNFVDGKYLAFDYDSKEIKVDKSSEADARVWYYNNDVSDLFKNLTQK